MPFVFPIIGCRKVEHLQENLKALDITLTPEQTQKIEGATKFDIGFPFKTFVSRVFPLMLLKHDQLDTIGKWRDFLFWSYDDRSYRSSASARSYQAVKRLSNVLSMSTPAFNSVL